jgi:hypothetical protein
MIFVAAFAVGTLAFRATLRDLRELWIRSTPNAPPGMRSFLAIQLGISALTPYLAALTAAVLVVRLRQPRPSLRRIGRQPGMVASTTATAAMAIGGVWIGSLLAAGSRFIRVETIFVGYAQEVSFAVLGAWVALAISGRWRAEARWIDRLGRLVGLTWIGVTVVSWARYYLL